MYGLVTFIINTMLYVLLISMTMIMAHSHFTQIVSPSITHLATFSYPRILNDAVVFSGLDNKDVEGLFMYNLTESNLNELMRIDTHGIPGTFESFSGVSLGHGGTVEDSNLAVTFIGSKKDHTGYGIYAVRGDDIIQLADSTTQVPNSDNNFKRFQFSGISESSEVVFYAVSGDTDFGGIYSIEDSGDVKKLVDFETEVPGLEGKTFDFLSNPVVSDKKVAFFGSRQADDNVVGSRASPGLYVYDLVQDTMDVVVDFSVHIPGTDEKFIAFSDTDFDGKSVAFVGKGSAGTMGIFSWSVETKSLRLIIDTKTSEISRFPETPSIWGSSLAFLGVDSNSKKGLYVWLNEKLHRIAMIDEEYANNVEFEYVGAGARAINDEYVTFYGVTKGDEPEVGIYVARLDEIGQEDEEVAVFVESDGSSFEV